MLYLGGGCQGASRGPLSAAGDYKSERVMAIEFRCAQCGRLLQAGDAAPGTRVLCPGCGAFSTISAPDVESAIEFRCTQCSKLLRTAGDTAGQQAKCPECGALMTVPQPGTGVPDETLPYVSPPAPPSDQADSPFAPGGNAAGRTQDFDRREHSSEGTTLEFCQLVVAALGTHA